MKRKLTLAAVVAAAVFVPAPAANADHLCVTSGSRQYCAPHVYITMPDRTCVTSNGWEIVCVF